LNFSLYNKAVADKESLSFVASGTAHEDCWIGNQRITTMAQESGDRPVRSAKSH
jgi:hypothetical protein